MNPRYPIYIISKGRWDTPMTARAFEKMKIPFRVVVEPQEQENYAAVIAPEKILVLPFSNLGQGSIPARNWVWEHSTAEGAARHWIVDDNIQGFVRLNRNTKYRLGDGTGFALMEQFVDRYENVPMAGPNYRFFAKQKQRLPAFYLNHRVYSCILLSNDVRYSHRWRGRYNEDTDLSLRFLKDGHCTILFNAFLSNKMATMSMAGGNTDTVYNTGDQRRAFAESLVEQHPDVTRVAWKFGRWHHQVDYSRFRHNCLIRKLGLVVPEGVNEYGMKLVRTTASEGE